MRQARQFLSAAEHCWFPAGGFADSFKHRIQRFARQRVNITISPWTFATAASRLVSSARELAVQGFCQLLLVACNASAFSTGLIAASVLVATAADHAADLFQFFFG